MTAANDLLDRLIALTEREVGLIDARDAAAIEALCAERDGLLDQLRNVSLDESSRDTLDRLRLLCARNEALAAAQAAEVRRELAHIGLGKSALTAYSPAGPLIAVDRAG